MAQKMMIEVTDDIDGRIGASTVPFGLDGVTYEIDLCDENAEALREIFGPYVAAARRTGGRLVKGAGKAPGARRIAARAGSNGKGSTAPVFSAASSSTPPEGWTARRSYNQAVREWATTQGLPVAERGRIASGVIDAYEAAKLAEAAEPVEDKPAPRKRGGRRAVRK